MDRVDRLQEMVHVPVGRVGADAVVDAAADKPFRGAWRGGSLLASPLRPGVLTTHRTSHRDRHVPRENGEIPWFLRF